MMAPAGQSEAGVRPQPDGQQPRDDHAGDDRARAEGKGADGKNDDDLERARAAARAADPRLQGIEKAREAARSADPGAGGGRDCLSAREARGAIADKRAVTLAHALRTARDAWDGEVIDYRLCTFDDSLAYDLTLLNSDGRVARVRVNAASGKLVGVR